MCSDECRKTWSKRPENESLRLKKQIEGVKKKYGSEYTSTSQIKEIREKQLQTFMGKGKEELDLIYNKAKETKIKKYGNSNNYNKILETKKITYGDQYYNNREKFKNTLIERYGSHHFKLDEFRQKSKETMRKNWGVDYVLQIPGNRERALENLKNKYGVENYVHSNEYKQMVIERQFLTIKNRLEATDLELCNPEDFIGWDLDGKAKNLTFRCKKCQNNTSSTTISHNVIPVCRTCYPVKNSSNIELEFEKILQDLNIVYSKNNKNIINPFEIDFYLEKHNIAFEINGNYWHSESYGGKDKNYHINKTINCYNKGIKLIHIFEDEFLHKKDIVKSRVKSILGLCSVKVFARKCDIRIIPNGEKKDFLTENHIQGDSIDKIRIGLYLGELLLAVMTFSHERISNGRETDENIYELNRFCVKNGYSIPGAFSKLLSYFRKNYKHDTIVTYSDIRWSGLDYKNSVYHKNGFEYVKNTEPNYWYVKIGEFLKRIHRFTFRKSLILKKYPDLDKNKTEFQLLSELGYDKIWDCGSMKFFLK
jgi:hypothetical protein